MTIPAMLKNRLKITLFPEFGQGTGCNFTFTYFKIFTWIYGSPYQILIKTINSLTAEIL